MQLDRAIRATLKDPGHITDDVITRLLEYWGDDSLTAGDQFLRAAIVETTKASGTVLQCGSGVMTLLLGLICQRTDKKLWTLEHNTHWANVTRWWLDYYKLTNTHIINVAAELSDGYLWYAIDASRLPANLSLVLCEGTGSTPTGIDGALHNLGKRLDHRAVLLVRNIRKRSDLDMLSNWAKSHNAAFVMRDKTDPFVKVALPDQTTAAGYVQDRLNTAFAKQRTN